VYGVPDDPGVALALTRAGEARSPW
jgi:hypothetical protein